MMRSLVLVALLMPGCREAVEESEGSRSASLAGLETPVLRRASEIPLVAIASVIPTFAGYYCESGNLVVLDTNPTGSIAAHVPDVTRESCREWRARPQANQPPVPNIVERPAQYSFLQLKGWRDLLSEPYLDLDGAIGIYIDCASNRLVITGSPNSLEEGVTLALSYAIPEEAVVAQSGTEFSDDYACTGTTTSLANCFAPIPGGARFAFTDNGLTTGGGFCTVGPAAQRLTSTGWENGWVINSHCAPRIWRLDNSWAWQPGTGSTKSSADFIGVETVDPSGWLCGNHNSKECRYSDAAWVTALPNSSGQVPELGKIAHARWNMLAINLASTRFSITSYRTATLGMTVDKVGAYSGHTRAAVSVVCGDYNRTAEGRALRMICQDRAPYIRTDGDSGSPVFYMRGDGTVDIVGIHWGADFDGSGIGIYSPWDGIVTDLGLISPYAP